MKRGKNGRYPLYKDGKLMEKLSRIIIIVIGFLFVARYVPVILVNLDHPDIWVIAGFVGVFLFALITEAFTSRSVFISSITIIALSIGLLYYSLSAYSADKLINLTSGLSTELMGIVLTVFLIDRINRESEKQRDEDLQREIENLGTQITELKAYLLDIFPPQ